MYRVKQYFRTLHKTPSRKRAFAFLFVPPAFPRTLLNHLINLSDCAIHYLHRKRKIKREKRSLVVRRRHVRSRARILSGPNFSASGSEICKTEHPVLNNFRRVRWAESNLTGRDTVSLISRPTRVLFISAEIPIEAAPGRELIAEAGHLSLRFARGVGRSFRLMVAAAAAAA